MSRKTGEGASTIAQIAVAVGVSKITVSRALRDSEAVRPELRARIKEVARASGYRVNLAARALRLQQTHVVAVVIETIATEGRPIADPIVLTMMGGLLDVLTPAGYALLVTTTDHLSSERGLAADGIVMIGQGKDGLRTELPSKLNMPFVAWGARTERHGEIVIGSDNRRGGQLAARHLTDRGRGRILFLGDPRHPEVAARLEGVRDVLAGAPAILAGTLPCEFSRSSARDTLAAALVEGVVFDAVVAVSDFIAAGACDALRDAGLAVPEAVAVTGFDDIAIATTHQPPLTSIAQDWHLAGRTLGNAILALLQDDGATANTDLLPVMLVQREST